MQVQALGKPKTSEVSAEKLSTEKFGFLIHFINDIREDLKLSWKPP